MQIRSAEFMKGLNGTDEILYDGVPQVAFVGRSNAGKSSVINALTGKKDLVKVGKKPGKTKDINVFKINKKFYLVDLPGYGYAKLSPGEKERIRKLMYWYLTYSEVRPLCIAVILDIKVGLTDSDREMLLLLREAGHPHLIIANKSDKLGPEAVKRQVLAIEDEAGSQVIPFSAKNKKGAAELLERLLAGLS